MAKPLILSIPVDYGDPKPGIEKLLSELRPRWAWEKTIVQTFSEGFANKSFMCHEAADSDQNDAIVIRVFNKTVNDINNGRDSEVMAFQLSAMSGCVPPLCAMFHGGIAYGFFPGKTLNYYQSFNDHIIKEVGKLMARLHMVDTTKTKVYNTAGHYSYFSPKPQVWDKLQLFLKQYPTSFSDAEHEQRFKSIVPPKVELEEEINKLKERFSNINIPLVFSHNDFHLKNIIYDPKSKKMNLVDYEMAFVNYEPWDMTIICQVTEISQFFGFVKEPTQFISDDLVRRYIRAYLQAKCEIQGEDPSSVTDHHVHKFFTQTKICYGLHYFFLFFQIVIIAGRPFSTFDSLGCVQMLYRLYRESRVDMFTLEIPQ